MSIESLKRKLHILRSLSRLRRIRGVMKKKQVKQFWIRNILKNRDKFGTFSTLLGELKKGCKFFFDSVFLKL